mmetsp:Transcript_9922/g.21016  ORF Transcript_9922/g.21016 Transcript_9922/m.21016 type:complete len:246 (+) Transcript_9922:173-910(+)
MFRHASTPIPHSNPTLTMDAVSGGPLVAHLAQNQGSWAASFGTSGASRAGCSIHILLRHILLRCCALEPTCSRAFSRPSGPRVRKYLRSRSRARTCQPHRVSCWGCLRRRAPLPPGTHHPPRHSRMARSSASCLRTGGSGRSAGFSGGSRRCGAQRCAPQFPTEEYHHMGWRSPAPLRYQAHCASRSGPSEVHAHARPHPGARGGSHWSDPTSCARFRLSGRLGCSAIDRCLPPPPKRWQGWREP